MKNINVIDVLAQVQHDQNAILEDLQEINSSDLIQSLAQEEKTEFVQILEAVANKSAEVSQHLSEIDEEIKRTELSKSRSTI